VTVSLREFRWDTLGWKGRVLILAGLSLISVMLRLPLMNGPLCRPHEWLAAHTLLTMSIWEQTGLAQSNYAVVMTFPNDADRYITYSSYEMDASGNSYFVSFPPFGFLLPYLVFQALGVRPSPLALQILNMSLHLASAVFVYLLLKDVTRNVQGAGVSWAPLGGFAAYLFSPIALYACSNTYFSITAVQPFWMMAIYFGNRFLHSGRFGMVSFVGFILAALSATYTEWLGYSFLASVVLYCGVKSCRTNSLERRRHLLLGVLSGLLIAMSLTLLVLQYSRIDGYRSYLTALHNRYVRRSGIPRIVVDPKADQMNYLTPRAYGKIVYHYAWGNGPFVFVCGYLLVAYALFTESRRTPDRRSGNTGFILCVAALPVLLDHALLFNHTAYHQYATLKSAPLLSIGASVLARRLAEHARESRIAFNERALAALFTGACLASALLFMYQRYGDAALDCRGVNLGYEFRRVSTREETLFVLRKPYLRFISPIITYHAGRNIGLVDSVEEARGWLKRYHRPSAVVFDVDATLHIVATTRLAL